MTHPNREELAGRKSVYVRVLKSELDTLREIADDAWKAAAALRQSPSVEEVAREEERIRRIIQTRLHLHPTDETLGCLDRAVSEIVNGTAALFGRGGGND